MLRARTLLIVPVMAVGIGLTGCDIATEDAGISVVASTSVYGGLVADIAGDTVAITSVIDDPSKDPHEYEADARTQLAVAHADLVVRNGGGYDDFIDTMLSATDNADVPVVDAVELSDFDSGAPDFNEHVWYDYPTVSEVVTAIETELTRLDPANAGIFSANADALRQELAGLQDRVAALNEQHAGDPVAITEPVPLLLLDAIGLVNRTPPEFSEAVENGTDAPARVMEQLLALFEQRDVAVLVYNPQTGGPQTDAVIEAAGRSGIPSVEAGELAPPGLGYIEWQGALLDDLEAALT